MNKKNIKKKKLLFLMLFSLLIGLAAPISVPNLFSAVEVLADTKLKAPELVSAKASSSSSITVEWKSVEGADGYRVYRKTADTKWKKIKTITNPATLSYKNKNLSMGVKYYYTVRPFKLVNGVRNWGAYDKAGLSATTIIPTPALSSVKSSNTSSITVNWKAVSGVTGYRIYRKELGTSSWVKIKTLSSSKTVSYTDKTVKMGKKYYYTVRAYKTVNGTRVWSSYDKKGLLANSKITAPTLTAVTPVYDGTLKITWNKVEGVDLYRIYRKTADSDFAKLGETYASSQQIYIDDECTPGQTYYYTVRGVVSTNGQRSYGSYNKTGLKGTAVVPTPKPLSASVCAVKKINVTWETVKNVDGYRIYRKTSTDDGWSKWKLIQTVSGASTSSYIDSDVQLGLSYRYTIRSYKVIGSKTHLSSYNSTGKKAACKAPAVKLLSVKLNGNNDRTITWEPLENADGYRIYRGFNTSYMTRLATIAGESVSSFTDKEVLEEGLQYVYTVRAYNLKNNQKIWGYYDTTGLKVLYPLNKPDTPELKTAVANGTTSLTITWEKVNNAQGYYVYKKESDGSWYEYDKIEGNDNTSFTDYHVAMPDTTYTYTVAAYKNTGMTETIGDYSPTGISATTPRGTIELSHPNMILVLNDSRQIEFLGTTGKPEWSSTNPNVAVYKDGRVYAVGTGTADIVAAFENKTYICSVTVEVPKINKTTLVLSPGNTAALEVLDTTLHTNWHVSDENYVKFSTYKGQKTQITALKPGRITIYAEPDMEESHYRLECDVIIAGTLKVTEEEIVLKIGESIIIDVTSDYDQLVAEEENSSILQANWETKSGNNHKLTIYGQNVGSSALIIRPPHANPPVTDTIKVTVEPMDDISIAKEKLLDYIQLHGKYDASGNKYIEHVGTYRDIGYGKDHLYTWSITYEKTLKRFRFTMTTEADDAVHKIHMYLDIENAEKINIHYVYDDLTFTAVSSLYEYDGTYLTYDPTESISNDTLKTYNMYANKWCRIAFEGWEANLLRSKIGISVRNIGFINYNINL